MPTLNEIDTKFNPSKPECLRPSIFLRMQPPSQIPLDPQGTLSGPDGDSHFTNDQLAHLLRPPAPTSPFARVNDLSLLEINGESRSAGRFASRTYANNEDIWVDSTNERIKSGDIDERTLVVAVTGHGPAIGWAMAQEFGSDVFFSLPGDLIKDKTQRNEEQAQTFFEGIHEGQQTRRRGGSTLLSFDAHQDELDSPGLASKLPSAQELRQQGIEKVFLAVESPPGQAQRFFSCSPANITHPTVTNWLKQVQRDGLPVVTDGIDKRVFLPRE